MKLIALKKIGRTHPGDVFEVRDKDARVFMALKLAKPYEAPPEPPRTPPAAKVEAPAQVAAIESKTAPSPTKDDVAQNKAPAARPARTYQRRDLTATD